ncbi:3043_t:CDS:2, partial [Entrophospora sp. SA101]
MISELDSYVIAKFMGVADYYFKHSIKFPKKSIIDDESDHNVFLKVQIMAKMYNVKLWDEIFVKRTRE